MAAQWKQLKCSRFQLQINKSIAFPFWATISWRTLCIFWFMIHVFLDIIYVILVLSECTEVAVMFSSALFLLLIKYWYLGSYESFLYKQVLSVIFFFIVQICSACFSDCWTTKNESSVRITWMFTILYYSVFSCNFIRVNHVL